MPAFFRAAFLTDARLNLQQVAGGGQPVEASRPSMPIL
jgi:hypothetical protein